MGGHLELDAYARELGRRRLPESVTRQSAPGSPVVLASLERNTAGVVTERSNDVGQLSTWSYDSLGRITDHQIVAGQALRARQTLTYLGTDDVKTVVHELDGNRYGFHYEYDRRHQLIAARDLGWGYQSDYQYSGSGRMVSL